MWTVYIIQQSISKELYVGVTSDLKERIEKHNAHHKGACTRRRHEGEWILVYAEAYRDKEDAYTREFRLKQRGRAKQEVLKRAERSLLS
jgi:predicted GIY-YIG superfamily endonuclease